MFWRTFPLLPGQGKRCSESHICTHTCTPSPRPVPIHSGSACSWAGGRALCSERPDGHTREMLVLSPLPCLPPSLCAAGHVNSISNRLEGEQKPPDKAAVGRWQHGCGARLPSRLSAWWFFSAPCQLRGLWQVPAPLRASLLPGLSGRVVIQSQRYHGGCHSHACEVLSQCRQNER